MNFLQDLVFFHKFGHSVLSQRSVETRKWWVT